MGDEVRKLKLKLSDKSTIVPENRTTIAVAKKLNEANIPMRTAKTCDDVGIQMGAGKRRQGKSQNKRIRVKTKRRSARTKALVKKNRQALKLVMTGVAPQQSYGHEVNGASPTQTQQMRVNLKSAMHFGVISTLVSLEGLGLLNNS